MSAITQAAIGTGVDIVTDRLVVDYESPRGSVRALDHPGLRVEAGSSVAVMGPSGCGKSTLLGLLAGLAVPTRGSVTIGGEVVSALSERQRLRFRRDTIGMVYQADNLLPHLTVEENVGLPLAIARAHHRRTTRGPARLMERLGIAELADRFPDQLSGGQRQRVAVARAVAHGPRVVLADEPTGSLDERNARTVVELLVHAQLVLGATLVLVTHDPGAAAYADRAVLLDRPSSDGAVPRAR